MKIIMIALVFMLSACAQQLSPCMTSTEVGVIKSKPAPVSVPRGMLTRDYRVPAVFIVEVNGLSRVCQIDAASAVLLEPGMKVRLTHAYRKA